MTKLINGKTNENELNIIQTHNICEPELAVPNGFTALHLASICANLYNETSPDWQMREFTICQGGDFAMYNVHDKFDMAEHYFYTAFSIGESVTRNTQYSVQEAYEDAIGISADTVVREEVMSDVICAIENYKENSDNPIDDDYIEEDYQILRDQEAENKIDEIARLERQLADLKES